MDRAAIEARIAELRAQAAKLQADFNAINGAIQDCQYWLAVLDEKGP